MKPISLFSHAGAIDGVKLCVTAQHSETRKNHAKVTIDFLNDKEPVSDDFNAKMFASVVQSISTLAEFVGELQDVHGKVYAHDHVVISTHVSRLQVIKINRMNNIWKNSRQQMRGS
jgi:hypothetical protein